jgi:hypothetical protein
MSGSRHIRHVAVAIVGLAATGAIVPLVLASSPASARRSKYQRVALQCSAWSHCELLRCRSDQRHTFVQPGAGNTY